MENIWQITFSFLGAIGGLTGLLTLFAYYRKVGRKYDVENDSTEIKSLREVIDILQKSKDALEKRVDALENALGIKNAEIVKIESENTKRKRAMNNQSECKNSGQNCPILNKYNELNGQKNN